MNNNTCDAQLDDVTGLEKTEPRCRCVRERGHAGEHRCTHGALWMRTRTEPAPHQTPADIAAKQVRKLQWQLLEAALFALSNAQFEYERNLESEAGLVWMNDTRRALGALALSLSDGPDAAGYAELLREILAEPQVRGR